METSIYFEIISLVVLVLLLLFGVIRGIRKPHVPSNKESIFAVIFYAILALIFGGVIWWLYGMHPAVEFYSGWLTEYSLSVDNLFVFILIIAKFKVPKKLQKEALGVGIIIALVCRAIFIVIGGAVVARFTWIFYLFGAFLIYTAAKILVDRESEDEYEENFIVRFFHKVIPMSSRYNGTKLRIPDKNDASISRWTPMLIVFISLGVTDLFFAFDSIPAIFGLTKDPFIVFATNLFALMGLQQLYFLLGGLVEKLQFLPIGLAIILAFIGVKLIFEALHGSGFTWAPEVPNLVSLMVIIIVIGVTSAASVMKIRQDERRAKRRAQLKAEIKDEIKAELENK
ncbi:MAG: TerC/Alx family metal homeostasis membrane protein [Candidatus Ancillula sp.]|jgi:tellurite resistance protein TerC|nr:TerC/Alx family metal homeostasis membrane protein [Candidatus Ancillula sp.]